MRKGFLFWGILFYFTSMNKTQLTPSLTLIIGIILISIYAFKNRPFMNWALFDLNKIRHHKAYHKIVTSTLIHFDTSHLVFNLFTLYSFSHSFDRWLGPWYAVSIFFIAGILANLFVLIIYRNRKEYYALGASGGVSGVIFASIWLLPSTSFYLFFIPYPISDRLFCVIYLLVSGYYMGKGEGKIGHSAHIGGAIAGLLCGLVLRPEKAIEEPLLLLWFALPFAAVYVTRAFINFRRN